MTDIDDRIDVGNALRLLDKDKKAPMAMCPSCNEPLVSTLEFRGAEFLCVPENKLFGFLSPRPAEATPELDARLKELETQYEADRAKRKQDANAR
jgi:hypothetical protein